MVDVKRKSDRTTRPVSTRVTLDEHKKLVILSPRLGMDIGAILRLYGVKKAVGLFDKKKGKNGDKEDS